MISILYTLIVTTLTVAYQNNLTTNEFFYSLLCSCSIVILIYLGLFVLRAVATCIMAKKRKLKNWWLGMIPYANYITLGKLAGRTRIFSMDFKNIGIVVCFSALACDVASAIMYLPNFVAIFQLIGVNGTLSEDIILALQNTSAIYTLVDVVAYVCDIAFVLSYAMLALAIFSKYAPQKRILYTLLSMIQPLFGILLLVIMNNRTYSSVDEFYREKMARQYGQTYNPYQNPFSTNENPFDEQQSNNENPFDEY